MNIIYTKFLSLNLEKQEAILNAALKEFAQKGFKNASTNEIIKEAGISKGLLFHYFNNKKDLFLFLYDYSLEVFMSEFFGKINLNEKDVLNRLRQMALLKIQLIRKYPQMFDFILTANVEESAEVKNELENRNKEIISNSYGKLFKDIDISSFKEGIDVKRAIDIIIWTLEGFSAQEQKKVKSLSLNEYDFDAALAEMDVYMELLRKCLYK